MSGGSRGGFASTSSSRACGNDYGRPACESTVRRPASRRELVPCSRCAHGSCSSSRARECRSSRSTGKTRLPRRAGDCRRTRSRRWSSPPRSGARSCWQGSLARVRVSSPSSGPAVGPGSAVPSFAPRLSQSWRPLPPQRWFVWAHRLSGPQRAGHDLRYGLFALVCPLAGRRSDLLDGRCRRDVATAYAPLTRLLRFRRGPRREVSTTMAAMTVATVVWWAAL